MSDFATFREVFEQQSKLDQMLASILERVRSVSHVLTGATGGHEASERKQGAQPVGMLDNLMICSALEQEKATLISNTLENIEMALNISSRAEQPSPSKPFTGRTMPKVDAASLLTEKDLA